MFVNYALPIQNTSAVLLVPKQSKEKENHCASVMSNPSLTLGQHLQFGTKNVHFNPTHASVFPPTAKIYHKSKVENRWFSKAWGFCFFFLNLSEQVHQTELVSDTQPTTKLQPNPFSTKATHKPRNKSTLGKPKALSPSDIWEYFLQPETGTDKP